jgi:hypothetical protein
MTSRSLTIAAGILSCMACTALAQTRVDRSFTVTAKNCDGVEWSQEALETYPNIASACQSVEERDGKSFVRFSGTVKRNEERGKRITVDFKDGGELTLTPPPETRLYVNDRHTRVADLQRGDELNFYIAEDRLAAQFADTQTPTAATRFVIIPIVLDETVEEGDSEGGERMAATLPSTASSLPMLGLCGFAMLGLGALLTFSRRR